ncbi:MAG: tetratricopeptide repeat protein [Thermomicrobiales bacterium]
MLDNCEHLHGVADLVAMLLPRCPGLQILATSRSPLRLQEEYRLPVKPLPLPAERGALVEVERSPAVRLFAERVRAVRPDFALTAANAAQVSALCRHLDGLPLALELASARSALLSPEGMLAQMSDRFPLLSQGARNLPPRLQTMRAAIAWSFDLLGPAEQDVFRRLAVFAGGFTLAAAGMIAVPHPGGASPLDAMTVLGDAALVRRLDPPATHGVHAGVIEPRFVLLETIRAFAREELAAAGDEALVRARHAAFYRELASNPTAATGELEADLPNLRDAFAWLCENGAAALALEMAVHLDSFWLRHGEPREGRDWLERALALSPEVDQAQRAAALGVLGMLRRELGEPVAAKKALRESLELARAVGDPSAEAAALAGLGALADDVGDHATTRAMSQASASICREIGDASGLVRALHNWGWAEAGLGRVEVAVALFHEALDSARAAGDMRSTARVQSSLGEVLAAQGDLRMARSSVQHALAVAQAAGDRASAAEYAGDLGWLALDLGDFEAARVSFAACLAEVGVAGRWRHTVMAIEGCAVQATMMGEPERAHALVAASAAWRVAIGLPTDNDPRITASDARRSFAVLHQLLAAPGSLDVMSIHDALRDAQAFVAESLIALPALTPRERDVLRLVAAGQSDRAIGDALFISRRTASKHVAAILAKLGVNTRAEAAARAVRDGLA